MFIKLLTLILLVATLGTAPLEDQRIYARCMEVVNLDYENDIVTCVDAAGFAWEFYGCEDYCENDLVCALMCSNGTDDTILDDAILDVIYTGYWVD